jgi:hypothetical protein
MPDTAFLRRSLLLIGGLIIWAVHLGVVYGFNGLACARRFAEAEIWGVGTVPLFVGGTTLLALALTTVLMVVALRRDPAAARYEDETEAFLSYSSAAVAALSLLAIAWNGLPALIVPACA